MSINYWIFEYIITYIECFVGFRFIALIMDVKVGRLSTIFSALLNSLMICFINQFSLFTSYSLFISIFLYTILSNRLYHIKVMDALCVSAFYTVNFLSFIDLCCIFMVSRLTNNEFYAKALIQELSFERGIFAAWTKVVLCLALVGVHFFVRKHPVKLLFTEFKLVIIIIAICSYFGFSYLGSHMFVEITERTVEQWIFTIFVLTFVFLSVVLYFNYRRILEMKDKMELKNKVLEANYNGLRSASETEKRLMHDFRNHLKILHKYLEDQNNRAALDYVNAMSSPLQEMYNEVWTGHDVMDFILNIKKKEAEEKGIKFYIDTKIYKFEINDKDLNCILSNVLDNAIEASVDSLENRRIDVYVGTINETLLIRVKNFHGNHVLKKKNLLVTNKAVKRNHGLGLTIVKRTLDKYGGYMDTMYDDDIFQVLITIPVDMKTETA